MLKKSVVGWWRRTRRFVFDGKLVSRIAAFNLLVVLAACGPPTSHGLNAAMMRAETSAIPGAQARVLPAAAGSASVPATADYCVTAAGYCPLGSAVEPGRNCLCQAGQLMYGGQTGVAPQTDTYRAPD